MRAAIAAPHTEDGLDLRIREHPIDVRSPVLPFPCQVIMKIRQSCELSASLYPIAHLLQKSYAVRKLLLPDGKGRGHKTYGVPLL